MREDIFERMNFDDVDDSVAYLKYDSYDPPLRSDVPFDTVEEKTIVLRNRSTGRLERLKYILSGYRPGFHSGYSELWGDLILEGRHAVLLFRYDSSGDCLEMVVIFCARNMPLETYIELCRDIKYGAEATARY